MSSAMCSSYSTGSLLLYTQRDDVWMLTLGRQTPATRRALSAMRMDLIFGMETAKYTTYKQFKILKSTFFSLSLRNLGRTEKRWQLWHALSKVALYILFDMELHSSYKTLHVEALGGEKTSLFLWKETLVRLFLQDKQASDP